MNKELTIEQRSIAVAELRASEGDEPAMEGYAASFNVLSGNLGGYRETIAPGAFTKSLATGADVRCLFNHDASQVLGRRSAGTLEVSEDKRGLKFRCALDPNNTDHMNLRASILRGDIKECSFAFTVPAGGDDWDEGTDENGLRYVRRTLRNVNLLDVSAVTYPAYSQKDATEVQARAAGNNPDLWARLNAIDDKYRQHRAAMLGVEVLKDLKLK